MYTLIGKLKWYWQVLITVLFVTAVIVLYLLGRSWGYDKAFKKFQAEDKVKEQQSAQLINRAQALEQRVLELEPKLAAYEKLDDEKKRLDGTISEKIDAAVEEGKKRDANTDLPADCDTRAERTCANFRELKIPFNCPEYKKRICSVGVGTGCK